MPDVRLSVLDLIPVVAGASSTEALRHALELALHVEKAGFYRYWLGEHHGIEGFASSAPTVVAAWLAGHTSQLRIGVGGVLLQNNDAFTVAQNFHTLEALFPGRIDLGIGGGQGMHTTVVEALIKTEWAPRPTSFERRLHELLSILGSKLSPSAASNLEIPITPRIAKAPPVWILASTEAGAARAANLQLPLAFAHHLEPDRTIAALTHYREQFSRLTQREPYIGIAVGIIVGENDDHAHWLSRAHLAALAQYDATGQMRHIPHPDDVADKELGSSQQFIANRLHGMIIGGQGTVQRQLIELITKTGTQEVLAMTISHDPNERLQSFSRLAALPNMQTSDP
jgi:luciferase family oxidoreductase group 1